MKTIGLIVCALILLAAVFVAYSPWRVHGGRFVTEYMLLAGVIALVAIIIGYVSMRWGG